MSQIFSETRILMIDFSSQTSFLTSILFSCSQECSLHFGTYPILLEGLTRRTVREWYDPDYDAHPDRLLCSSLVNS